MSAQPGNAANSSKAAAKAQMRALTKQDFRVGLNCSAAERVYNGSWVLQIQWSPRTPQVWNHFHEWFFSGDGKHYDAVDFMNRVGVIRGIRPKRLWMKIKTWDGEFLGPFAYDIRC